MGEKFEPADYAEDIVPESKESRRLYDLECRMAALDGNRAPMPARGQDGFQDYVHQELWDLDERLDNLNKGLGMAFLLISAVCWVLILSNRGE